MKKNILSNFTKIIYALFAIGTIISIYIVYEKVDNDSAIEFLFGYMYFTLFFVVYIPVTTILNSKGFKLSEIVISLFKIGNKK